MMNFEQVDKKITTKGFRRSAGIRRIYDDEGFEQKVYDYEKRRGFDMFSVYLDEYDSVVEVEYTKIAFNRETGKYQQNVISIKDFKELNKVLA